MFQPVGVIDYGAGNLWSVIRALRHLGASVEIVREADQLSRVRALVLPGVGAFGWAVEQLKRRGLWQFLRNWLLQNKPFLGICLGMQLLMEQSEESPGVEGLGVVRGRVVRFRAKKVPQIGWNRVEFIQEVPPYDAGSSEYFYFVHSYYVQCGEQDAIVGWTEYEGIRYVSAIRKHNILAVQFHPEKSSEAGLNILGSWLNQAGC